MTTPAKTRASHGSFCIERSYPHAPAKVFRAFADRAAKERWFGGEAGQWEELERHFDFRPGGSERAKGRWSSGMVSDFDCRYYDIVPDERIVYAYEMHLNALKISVSLATIELEAQGPGTLLRITEQGVFLNGFEDGGGREQGTNQLLDRMGATLDD